jgi:anaerobic magnesium-protoporphyrin IX monomethyl ester cyclase
MNKTLLVNPPSPFLIDERVFQTLGILNIATQMKNDGQKVDVLDLNGNKDYISSVVALQSEYDLIGLTATTPQFHYAHKILKAIKDKDKDKKVIIGGAHATSLYPLRDKRDINIQKIEEFDSIISGEAEANYELIFNGDKWIDCGINKDMENLPLPNRDFFDFQTYSYKINGQNATNVQTQRGCPGKCTFCSGREIEMYKKVRSLPPERVIEELDHLNEKYGTTAFMFFDDEFNLNHKRTLELCDLLEDRDYTFRSFIRADYLVKRPEIAEAMAKAGCVEVGAGIESGSEKILDIIQKQMTPEINSQAREIMKDAGIRFKAFTILGHPYETLEDISLTEQWLLDNKPDDFDITIFQPYPGSKTYNNATPNVNKNFKEYEWDFIGGLFFNKPDYSITPSFYKGRVGEYTTVVRTPTIDSKTLVEKRDILEKRIRKIL